MGKGLGLRYDVALRLHAEHVCRGKFLTWGEKRESDKEDKEEAFW